MSPSTVPPPAGATPQGLEARTAAHGRSRAGLAIVLGALSAFSAISIDIYLPAFTALAHHFGTSLHTVQLSLPAYLVGLASGQLVHGPLSDRYGRRRPLLAGVALYTVASLALAFAPSIGVLIGLRFVQGLSGCAGVVITRAIVRDMFTGTEAARFFSLLLLVFGVAPVVAPLLGGQILAWVGWRGVFVALAGYGIACLAGVLWLPETLAAADRRRGGLRDALASYRGVLRHRWFALYAYGGSFSSAAMLAYITAAPAVIIDEFGVSPQRFGLVFGANALGFIGVSQLNRRLVGRFGPEAVLRRAVALQGAAALALLGVSLAGLGLAAVVVPMFVVVACLGATLPNSMALALAPFRSSAGAASAVIGTAQTGLGALAGVAVSMLPLEAAVAMAVVTSGACLIALAVLTLAAPRQPGPPA